MIMFEPVKYSKSFFLILNTRQLKAFIFTLYFAIASIYQEELYADNTCGCGIHQFKNFINAVGLIKSSNLMFNFYPAMIQWKFPNNNIAHYVHI